MQTLPQMSNELMVGDQAPLFYDARTLADATINLSTVGGRWVVLCFLPSLSDENNVRALVALLSEAKLFNDDHLVFYGVLSQTPPEEKRLADVSHKALGFIKDYSGDIARLYGAVNAPHMVVINPMLQIYAYFKIGEDGAAPEQLAAFIHKLPAVESYAGVSLSAPALIVPNIFEKEFCSYLIEQYTLNGGTDSGFMLDQDGKTRTVVDYSLKRRTDFNIIEPELRQQMRARIVRRLVPAIERYFQYKPTRMDRCLVSCYDSVTGGHFSRHRDNLNAGARHRRFAVTINLNRDYDGCDLVFPEFGRRHYRAPEAGAVVFSTSALHEVTPITRGTRYAFIPFLYGEKDVEQRRKNNALLHKGEQLYIDGEDRLFPETEYKISDN